MERRYDLLAEVGFRDITGYNAAYDRGDLPDDVSPSGEVLRTFPRLPFILVVIDELSDLMMVAARDVEDSICRIAQMARAVGIHLVIATQRPSVNVITGVIKANVPARLAFAVSSATDSRVILDQQGAERLIGKGDMLLLGPASSAPSRIQGSWVNEDEVRKVAAVWKRQAPEIEYDKEVQGADEAGGSSLGSGSGGGAGDDDDDLVRQAMELIVRSQLGLHLDAPAQAQGRLRPSGPPHGPARAAGRGRPVRGLQGPSGAHVGRGARERDGAGRGLSGLAGHASGDAVTVERPRFAACCAAWRTALRPAHFSRTRASSDGCAPLSRVPPCGTAGRWRAARAASGAR